jgi:hypothetical protein
VTIVDDEDLGKTILEIEVRGKRGVGYCKSMPCAVRPFARLRSRLRPARIYGVNTPTETSVNSNVLGEQWRTPGPTDLIFPKWPKDGVHDPVVFFHEGRIVDLLAVGNGFDKRLEVVPLMQKRLRRHVATLRISGKPGGMLVFAQGYVGLNVEIAARTSPKGVDAQRANRRKKQSTLG